MSMQIEFDDNYSETTYYNGTLKMPERKDWGQYRFVVEVVYFSLTGKWTISKISWDIEPPEDRDKAEKRIESIVSEWHGKTGDIVMKITPKGEKNE